MLPIRWIVNMMTSSNGNIFRPMTRIFDVFFDLRLNKPLSKQSWGWWFKTRSHPLWRHCNKVKKHRFRLDTPNWWCELSDWNLMCGKLEWIEFEPLVPIVFVSWTIFECMRIMHVFLWDWKLYQVCACDLFNIMTDVIISVLLLLRYICLWTLCHVIYQIATYIVR